LLTITGSVQIGDQAIGKDHGVALGRGGGQLTVTASQDSRVAMFFGPPIGEPIVRHGPFAMANAADIERAMADYAAGRMGRLP
jgi:quercetin 2,3-dioxygenase